MDWIQIQGESMRPCLEPGDWIAVEWTSLERRMEFATGALVLGKDSRNSAWIVHRVIQRDLIKGDAAFAWDDFKPEEIWGTVISIRKQHAYARPRRFETSLLDRMIAVFSAHTIPAESWSARFARHGIRVLGRVRRWML